jgi:hypothetical protein
MIMSILDDTSWDDGHHRSILFLEQQTLENYQRISPPSTVVVISIVPQFTQDVFAEGNLINISPMIPIDISVKPGIVENVNIGTSCFPEEIVTYTSLFKEFHDIFAWSYEEMTGIDPSIVVHEIKTYPGAKPVRQCLRPIHPHKAATIKLEVEKLLKAGFIYPVALTEWVSNPVPIDKRVVVFAFVLIIEISTKIVLRTIFQLLLSTRSSMIVPATKSFPSWMDFPSIIKSISLLRTNTKQLLSVLGVLSPIVNFLLV